MTSSAPTRVVWKHIGFHGHSVGTFTADIAAIQWKSAMLGNDDVSTSRLIPANSMTNAKWTVFGKSGHLRIQTTKDSGLKHELRFDGFPVSDYDRLKKTLHDFYQVTLEKHNMSSSGVSYGKTKIEQRNLVFRHMVLEDADEEGEEYEPRVGDELMSMDLAEVSQCVLPGNNRHEIELQFPESDTLEAGTDQLVAIRFYIPPDADFENNDKTVSSNAEIFQQRIMKTASIKKTTGNVIVEFPEEKGTFLTPRGRYSIELYDWFLRMRGNKYDYKIKYDDISRLFLLPKPDDVHTAFVIALDKPIRQGQQRYQNLVLQTNKQQSEVTINLDEETLQKEYNGDLQQVMTGSLSNLVAKTFKIIAKKKVFIPGKFANANQQACVKCALRANEGLLYPLEKQFVFIHKPPVLIRFDEVDSVEFQRYAGGQGSTRNFDLCVTLKSSTGGPKEYTFSGIDRSDYAGLYNFLSGKRIRIKNLEEPGVEDTRPSKPIYNEEEIYGADLGEEEGSEDEDFDINEKHQDEDEEDSADDDIDDDDLGSEIDDDMDSDLEEARQKAGVARKKAPKKRKVEEEEEEEEVPQKKKKKPSETPKPPPKKKKDPNQPKKPISAYMFYMSKNRARVKEENPEATFGELAKLVSRAFKSLSKEALQEYKDMEKQDKARYQEEMAQYKPEDDDGGGKKKKKKKDPNKPKRAMTAFMLFSNSVRAQIKEENPDISFGNVAKVASEKFKALRDVERAKWEDKADAEKERYRKEMQAYRQQEE